MPDYRAQARRAAQRYGIDPEVFLRQIAQESGFQPHVVSKAGARGIAQFMPATARSLGVNPDDPNQALSGAARLMSRYLKQYGGDWTKALTAYNAGPGAVGHSLPLETSNYISTILGGRGSAGMARLGASPSAPAPAPAAARYETVDDPAARHRVALANYLAKTRPDSPLLRLGVVSPSEATTRRVKLPGTPSPSPALSAPQGASGTKGRSRLLELFYDPLGGWKNGQSIGAIGGHSDHVHVAAGPKTLAGFERLAQQMGLTITSTTGGKHAPNSYHYKGEAADVAGSPALMAAFTKRIKRLYGLR